LNIWMLLFMYPPEANSNMLWIYLLIIWSLYHETRQSQITDYFIVSCIHCCKNLLTDIVETSVRNKCRCSFYCALFTLHVSAPIGGHLQVVCNTINSKSVTVYVNGSVASYVQRQMPSLCLAMIGGICIHSRTDGGGFWNVPLIWLRCHDVHTSFYKDWFRHSGVNDGWG
jgi:hypothetical protein